jgi:hypothetical protein
MARISKRTLSIIAAATVIGGSALGAAVSGGTAHAQVSASISLTSSAIDTGLGNYWPVLTLSVTCPTGYDITVYATVTQGVTFYGYAYLPNTPGPDACTGSPQTVSVQAQTTTAYVLTPTSSASEPKTLAPGPAYVGATLVLTAPGQPTPAPPASLAELTTIG